MAGTTKPVTMLVSEKLYKTPGIQELEKAGHTVHVFGLATLDLEDYDIIAAENCWRMTPAMEKWTKELLAAARNTRKRRATSKS